MAFPGILATIAGGTAVGGAVTSAIGSLFGGQAQANLMRYQAGVAEINAKIAKQDAAYAREAGEVEAQQVGMRTRAEVGATRAGIGAGNIDISSGSAARVIQSETAIGAENQAITRANAAKRAYGFEVKGAEDVAQAGAYRMGATTSLISGDIGATSSIIGAAGSVASKWLQAGQYFPGAAGGAPGGTDPNTVYA